MVMGIEALRAVIVIVRLATWTKESCADSWRSKVLTGPMAAPESRSSDSLAKRSSSISARTPDWRGTAPAKADARLRARATEAAWVGLRLGPGPLVLRRRVVA